MATADITPPMFCRNCSYPLRGMEQPRCPECGGASIRRTPEPIHAPRARVRLRKWLWRIPVALLAAAVFYVGSYVVLVEPGDHPLPAFAFTTGHDFRLTDRYVDPPPMPPATYSHCGAWAQWVYAPMNWVDRRIRVDYWKTMTSPPAYPRLEDRTDGTRRERSRTQSDGSESARCLRRFANH